MDLDELAPSPYRTAGERLLGHLRRSVLAELHAPDLDRALRLAADAVYRPHFAVALQDLVGLNVLARLIKPAVWALKHWSSDEALVERYIRGVIVNELSIDYGAVRAMYDYVLAAGKAAVSTPSDALRQEIFATHQMTCYSCGLTLVRRSSDRSAPTVEHVWPVSLGGDSDFRNLLPACRACNGKRGNHAVWPAFWFQSCYLKPHASEDEIETMLGLQTRVALQFFRAYEHAAGTGMSLKRALLEAGPMDAPDVSGRRYGSDFFSIVNYEERVQV